MFTGIVEAQGEVRSIQSGPSGGRIIEVLHPWVSEGGKAPLAIGDSIAHNGVCLTVTEWENSTYKVDVGPETLARTTIGELKSGESVNLERSVTLETRLGGHLVQGHVDAVGRVRTVTRRDNAWDVWINVSIDILRLVIPRGSVTVDGISLTVVDRDNEGFKVSIIPHTWIVTSLRNRVVGTGLNIEADVLVRYVQGLMVPLGDKKTGLSFERLAELGFGTRTS